MNTRPLDELEKLILRHLASGPCSASELTDALRASSQAHGVVITHAKVTYRLGGLVSLKLVGSAERKLSGQRRDFLYSLRAEPKATTEAAPPSVEVQAEPPKAESPRGAQELQPTEDAPPKQGPPKATKSESKSPSSARQDDPQSSPPAPREVYPQGREDYIRQRRAALVRAGLIKGASRCTR